MGQKDFDNQVLEEQDTELKEPDMYNIVLHNDNYTTMEFVVDILKTVFNKSVIDATKIMMDVHKKGMGIVGAYTYDVASTKIAIVGQKSKGSEYPLKCTMEKV